jgi:hypothetical protein
MRVFCGALLGLVFAIPSQAAVIYSASGSIGGSQTPDLGYVPAFTTQIQFTYQAGDLGTLVDEVNGNNWWHDSQLEVQASGDILASVWPYNAVIDLGVAQNGANTVSYGYNPNSQTLFGQLNSGPFVSAFGIRSDPVSSGFGQQIWAFGQADTTNLGTYAGYSDTISGVTIAVPEPATWAMMLAGFAGLGFIGSRRNKLATLAV